MARYTATHKLTKQEKQVITFFLSFFPSSLKLCVVSKNDVFLLILWHNFPAVAPIFRGFPIRYTFFTWIRRFWRQSHTKPNQIERKMEEEKLLKCLFIGLIESSLYRWFVFVFFFFFFWAFEHGAIVITIEFDDILFVL